jgi:sodium-dependent phosphate cotransporter
LDRVYPILLGANIGSSFTGILAALSSDPVKLRETLQIALCETLCNLFGVIMFYPIPFLRELPMHIAMTLGDVTAQVNLRYLES